MSLRGLIIFNEAIKGIQQGAQNISAVNDARAKNKLEEEKWGYEKKKIDSQLKLNELKGENTELQNELLRTQSKAILKQQDDIFKGTTATINAEEAKQKQALDQHTSAIDFLSKNDPDVQQFVYGQQMGSGLAGLGGLGEGTLQGTPERSNESYPEAMGSLFENAPSSGYEPKMDGKGFTKVSRADTTRQHIKQAKGQGIPLNTEEQAYLEGKKYSRDAVLKKAKLLVQNGDAKVQPTADELRSKIPEAERQLYGQSQTEQFEPGPKTTDISSAYKQDTKQGNEKIKVISPDGKKGFIPAKNLNAAIKKGFKRVSQ